MIIKFTDYFGEEHILSGCISDLQVEQDSGRFKRVSMLTEDTGYNFIEEVGDYLTGIENVADNLKDINDLAEELTELADELGSGYWDYAVKIRDHVESISKVRSQIHEESTAIRELIEIFETEL